jgi:hypothetical protein
MITTCPNCLNGNVECISPKECVSHLCGHYACVDCWRESIRLNPNTKCYVCDGNLPFQFPNNNNPIFDYAEEDDWPMIQSFIMSAESMTKKKFNELFDLLMVSPHFDGLFLDSNGDCLPFNRISDLSHLRTLCITDADVSDIDGLSGMNNLRYVYLFNNKITDLSPLYGLTNIKRLQLDNNNTIWDLTPLASLVGLTHLSLIDVVLDNHNLSILNNLVGSLPNLTIIWVDVIYAGILNNENGIFRFVDMVNTYNNYDRDRFYDEYENDQNIRLNRYIFTNTNRIHEHIYNDEDEEREENERDEIDEDDEEREGGGYEDEDEDEDDEGDDREEGEPELDGGWGEPDIRVRRQGEY